MLPHYIIKNVLAKKQTRKDWKKNKNNSYINNTGQTIWRKALNSEEYNKWVDNMKRESRGIPAAEVERATDNQKSDTVSTLCLFIVHYESNH